MLLHVKLVNHRDLLLIAWSWLHGIRCSYRCLFAIFIIPAQILVCVLFAPPSLLHFTIFIVFYTCKLLVLTWGVGFSLSLSLSFACMSTGNHGCEPVTVCNIIVDWSFCSQFAFCAHWVFCVCFALCTCPLCPLPLHNSILCFCAFCVHYTFLVNCALCIHWAFRVYSTAHYICLTPSWRPWIASACSF